MILHMQSTTNIDAIMLRKLKEMLKEHDVISIAVHQHYLRLETSKSEIFNIDRNGLILPIIDLKKLNR